MKENKYSNAINQLKFSSDFCEKTIVAIKEKERANHKSNRWLVSKYIFGGVAACACLAAVLLVAPMFHEDREIIPDSTSENIVNNVVEDQSEQPPVLNTPMPVQQDKKVVISSDYNGGGLGDAIAKPGSVTIEDAVKTAMADPQNENAYYYVTIFATLPLSEQEKYSYDNYIYNGRSISEWSELVDLANEEYPYNEYNGDHGGNVSEEEWRNAIEEAKTLDPQKNLAEATNEYDSTFLDSWDKARAEWNEAECSRLQESGYDVFLSDGEIQGLLTSKQILDFDANPECSHSIEWVRDENGVVDWNENNLP